MANRVIYTNPYDAEIEYLESTGTQWINTGIISMNVNDFEIVFDFINTKSGNVLICPNNMHNWYQRLILINIKTLFISGLYNTYNIELGNNYKIVFNNQKFTLYDSSNQELYQCNLYGTSTGVSTLQLLKSDNTHYGIFRIRKFYIKDTIDLIPVRRGNVGYMYDRVSGKFFGNSGTGNFILGPDINIHIKRNVIYTDTNTRCVIATRDNTESEQNNNINDNIND